MEKTIKLKLELPVIGGTQDYKPLIEAIKEMGAIAHIGKAIDDDEALDDDDAVCEEKTIKLELELPIKGNVQNYEPLIEAFDAIAHIGEAIGDDDAVCEEGKIWGILNIIKKALSLNKTDWAETEEESRGIKQQKLEIVDIIQEDLFCDLDRTISTMAISELFLDKVCSTEECQSLPSVNEEDIRQVKFYVEKCSKKQKIAHVLEKQEGDVFDSKEEVIKKAIALAEERLSYLMNRLG